MTVKVGLYPHCCGAKIIYDFPTGTSKRSIEWMESQIDHNTGYTREVVDSYIKKNETLRNLLRSDIQKFFEEGFDAHSFDATETYPYRVNKRDRRAEGSSPLDKNSWVFAIVNDDQVNLCRPVLEEFGFKCIEESENPNSGHMIYLFLLKPNW